MKTLVRRDVLNTLRARSTSHRVEAVGSAVRAGGFDVIAVYHEHVIASKDGEVVRLHFSESADGIKVEFEEKETLSEVMITEEEAEREVDALCEEFSTLILDGKSSEARGKLSAIVRKDERYEEV